MFDKQKKLPSSEYFRRIAPLAEELRVRKNSFDIDLKNNFCRANGLSLFADRSADEPDAMKEYVSKLSSLSVRCKKFTDGCAYLYGKTAFQRKRLFGERVLT